MALFISDAKVPSIIIHVGTIGYQSSECTVGAGIVEWNLVDDGHTPIRPLIQW